MIIGGYSSADFDRLLALGALLSNLDNVKLAASELQATLTAATAAQTDTSAKLADLAQREQALADLRVAVTAKDSEATARLASVGRKENVVEDNARQAAQRLDERERTVAAKEQELSRREQQLKADLARLRSTIGG
jgi:hypothetical protein